MRGAAQQAEELFAEHESRRRRSPRAFALWEELCAACDIERAQDKNLRARRETVRGVVFEHMRSGAEITEQSERDVRVLAELPEAVGQ